jgi:flagellar basal body-associated protein FliL
MGETKESKSAEAPSGEGQKKSLPIKAVAIVGALMLVEGAAVVLVMRMTSPTHASAEEVVEIKDQTDGEALVEIPLVSEKFQNMQTGRVWIWDADIVLKVRAKNQAAVEKTLEARAAEIREGVGMIFRRAAHSHLKEPGLETLNRQLTSFVDEVLGKDAEGKSRLERVVIPKCRGFPAD